MIHIDTYQATLVEVYLMPKCHLKASKDCFRNDGVSNLIFKEKNGVIDELQERDL